jgi:hypothetical protein
MRPRNPSAGTISPGLARLAPITASLRSLQALSPAAGAERSQIVARVSQTSSAVTATRPLPRH